jgi:hypothetical protein
MYIIESINITLFLNCWSTKQLVSWIQWDTFVIFLLVLFIYYFTSTVTPQCTVTVYRWCVETLIVCLCVTILCSQYYIIHIICSIFSSTDVIFHGQAWYDVKRPRRVLTRTGRSNADWWRTLGSELEIRCTKHWRNLLDSIGLLQPVAPSWIE